MTLRPRELSYHALGPSGFYKVAYLEWGDPQNPEVLVCAHGLTRNAHDFDFLARELQDQYRIVCPDIVGRGHSDFTKVPETYTIQQYVQDMVALLARIDVEKVNWLGTSMGGIIGMAIAVQANTPIKRLILNDLGMVIQKESVVRIKSYATKYPLFNTLEEAKKDMQSRLVTFGQLKENEWQHLVNYGFQKGEDGKWHYAYDPAIMRAVEQSEVEDTNLEHLWRKVTCPTLIIHGAESDLLLRQTIDNMIKIHPDTTAVDIPHVGHAPTLIPNEQIQIIKDWLNNEKTNP